MCLSQGLRAVSCRKLRFDLDSQATEAGLLTTSRRDLLPAKWGTNAGPITSVTDVQWPLGILTLWGNSVPGPGWDHVVPTWLLLL